MKAVYGDTGFWSWLRYWYLDSADFVTLMLMDKGYYDYDYKEPEDEVEEEPETSANDDELREKLIKNGIKPRNAQPPTDEEIQTAGLEFLKSRGKV